MLYGSRERVEREEYSCKAAFEVSKVGRNLAERNSAFGDYKCLAAPANQLSLPECPDRKRQSPGKSFSTKVGCTTEEKLKQEPILQGILEKKTMDSLYRGKRSQSVWRRKTAGSRLARALYDDVDVMILDEVTSNIDKESAEMILRRVIENGREKIIFMISHDSMPEVYANKILQL